MEYNAIILVVDAMASVTKASRNKVSFSDVRIRLRVPLSPVLFLIIKILVRKARVFGDSYDTYTFSAVMKGYNEMESIKSGDGTF